MWWIPYIFGILAVVITTAVWNIVIGIIAGVVIWFAVCLLGKSEEERGNNKPSNHIKVNQRKAKANVNTGFETTRQELIRAEIDKFLKIKEIMVFYQKNNELRAQAEGGDANAQYEFSLFIDTNERCVKQIISNHDIMLFALQGHGVVLSKYEARKWLREAAKKGHLQAKEALDKISNERREWTELQDKERRRRERTKEKECEWIEKEIEKKRKLNKFLKIDGMEVFYTEYKKLHDLAKSGDADSQYELFLFIQENASRIKSRASKEGIYNLNEYGIDLCEIYPNKWVYEAAKQGHKAAREWQAGYNLKAAAREASIAGHVRKEAKIAAKKVASAPQSDSDKIREMYDRMGYVYPSNNNKYPSVDMNAVLSNMQDQIRSKLKK